MIIGITGSIGGGKGTVVDYLIQKKNFAHYSSSGRLIELLEERGEFVDRDAMNRIANELRQNDPAGVPAENYKKYLADGSPADAIFESLHSVPEAQFVKDIGGIVIAVTADADVRFERISKRGSVKDNVTKEEFIAQQDREEKGSDDPNKSNIFNVIKFADYKIENSADLNELYAQIDEFLQKFA
jgi:hypothetical protein